MADASLTQDLFARQGNRSSSIAPTRAIEIGTAGEHLVCADVLLSGRIAYQASQGLPYDVVIDNGVGLLRVAVKSTLRAVTRPTREAFRVIYMFAVTRSRRLSSGKTDARKYTKEDTDLVAFVALDKKLIAYCHISECAQAMHFDIPGASLNKNMRGIIPGKAKKTFGLYTLERALAVHSGEIVPFSVEVQKKRQVVTADQVREMRRLRAAGWTYRKIGEKFNVTMGTPRDICNGLTWKGVE